jgi:hypothetical protein
MYETASLTLMEKNRVPRRYLNLRGRKWQEIG